MASKSKRARMAPQRNYTKTFMYWAIAVFALKLIIIFNIQGAGIDISGNTFFVNRIWLGADGENYLKGFDAMLKAGVFSNEGTLNYWPAGYPLAMLCLTIFGKAYALMSLSIIQSILFSFATYFFALQLSQTRLKKFSYLVFILVILNPTLSLSSLTIGYESLTASGFLITTALIIKDFIQKDDNKFFKYVIINSTIFGFLTFLQPRLVVSGILINLFWILTRKRFKTTLLLVSISLVITLLFPATLMFRNHKAIGIFTISTNLGATMNVGAGDNATGGYQSKVDGVPCKTFGTISEQDNQKVMCVLNWYVSNPTKAIKLFYNKTIYFWSPWIGPEANGTMGRNPWLKVNPIKNIASTPEGEKLVYGGFGKLISWLWLLGGLGLLLYGYRTLWRQNSLERFIANIAMIAITTNWLLSLISIGDHRFRIPIMGMSLFLQAIGLKTLFKGGKAPMVEGPALR